MKSPLIEQMKKTDDKMDLEIGPVKVSSEGYATYILIASILIVGLVYIYARFIHHRILKRKHKK